MIDQKNDAYVNEMFWPSFYVSRPDDHWVHANKGEWTPEKLVEYLKSELNGLDPIVPTGNYVLIKRPKAPEKIGSLYLTTNIRENAYREVSTGKVLDWGPDSWRYKRVFPSGPRCNRMDWVVFKTYEHTPIPLEKSNELDFELLYVYDEKIVGPIEKFQNLLGV